MIGKTFTLRAAVLVPGLLLLLASCGTSRQVQKSESGAAPASAANAVAAYAQKVIDNAATAETLTAKLGDIKFNGKGIPFGSGELRMKRGDVIQLIISVPFMGEVGRMQFTADEVLVVNRIDKEYVRVSYADIDFLKSANLDFNSLQALFWNELFVPGSARLTSGGSAKSFSISASGDHTLLSLKTAPRLDYFFLTRTKDGVIDRTSISPKAIDNNTELIWKYGNFTTFKGHPFPGQMSLSLKGLKQDFALDFSLSGLSADASWSTRTTLSEKYKQRSVNDILRKFSNISGF